MMTSSRLMTGYAQSITPNCDETLYITLDSNGDIEESSVVKRYEVREDGVITDYGTYESVSNLTTREEPVIGEDGSVSFPVKASDGTFYFEGKTRVDQKSLPWTIHVRYLLNGVETAPENLAGQSGLIEIETDLIPNKNVSDYYRNNMALTMAAMVDRDDVLSIRAEGAQIQTVGNMSAIVYFALPGEECHYTIAIGSDDFSFTGLVFMMMPLTLAQLDEVADLKDAKETLEDSMDAAGDSLDVILDTMEQMKTGISDTANGLRGLDDAREIIHSSRNTVYDQADQALADLDQLAQSLKPFQEHTAQAQNMLVSIRSDVNELTSDINELEPKLGDLKDTVRYLRDDISMIQEALSGPQSEAASQAFLQLLEKTKADLIAMKTSQESMATSIRDMGELIARLQQSGSNLDTQSALLASLDGDTDYDPDEIEDLVAFLEDDIALIDDVNVDANDPNPAADHPIDEATVPGNTTRKATGSDWNLDPHLTSGIGEIMNATAGLTGNSGVAADVAAMIQLTERVLMMLDGEQEHFSSAMAETKDLLSNIGKICEIAEDITNDIDDLNQTLEVYHPEALKTLEDAGILTDRAATGVESLSAFFKTLENQIRNAGGTLNEGTKQTLNGLANVLDHAGEGLDQTDVIRSAKNTIRDTIDDEWDKFSDEHTTILNIDLDARPVSITSAKNPSPRSMQIVLRTKEITKDDEDDTAVVDEDFHPDGSIFHRIGIIFKKIWDTICSLFQ